MTLPNDAADLLDRAAAWTGPENDFAELAQVEGLDFATALLYDRLLRVPANAEFLRLAREGHRPAITERDFIGIVPGAFHREHRHTSADGAAVLGIARELGCAAEVIPTASLGRLDENAGAIFDWLTLHQGRRIILISLSKGGAEVKRALALRPSAFASVSAWVSFSGIVQGTPLIAWLRRRPLRWWSVRLWLWWRGYPAEALDELRYDAASTWTALPEHLRVIHVCGLPFQRHLAHPWAPRGYARISPLGPNDGGGILLADTLRWPGIVCPILGADHYLAPRWDVLPLLTGIIAGALRK